MCGSYFDDILVFSRTKEEHHKHLRQLMMVPKQEQLYGNLKRCSLFTLEVVFLGYIVSVQGIQVDQSKIYANKTWPIPTPMHDVRSFHGLASFSRRFNRYFSTLAAPMNEELKGTKFM